MNTESVLQAPFATWQKISAHARRLLAEITVRRARRRLRLQETLSLGDRRFLAIVELNGREFLLGCTQASVSLLKELPGAATRAARDDTAQDSASGPSSPAGSRGAGRGRTEEGGRREL